MAKSRRKDSNLPPILWFGDDLGAQTSLPISPDTWRKYLKPAFSTMYKCCHDEGCLVYMHTDGHILDIIPDLKECGVDILNSQVGANGIEELAGVCKGLICVDADIDRQKMPGWTPAQVEEHVEAVVKGLGSPEGGLWPKAELGPDIPLEIMDAVRSSIERNREYWAGK